ncbi:MAG: YckD family protein [Bacteroidia bacterium]|nr:YckD family protein [Bacteroidia bacterium]
MSENLDEREGMGTTEEMVSQSEPLSLTDKFIGVITEPADTFAIIRAAGPKTSDWIVPLLVMAIILGISMFVRFSNPETAAQMQQQQEMAIQKRVDAGQMTQEQADQTIEQMEQFGGMTKIFAPIGAVLGYVAIFFLLCLFYWLIVRFIMKGDTNYSFILSVVGLSAFISAIDQIISILLMVVTGNAMANLSPALFVDSQAAGKTFYLLMVLAPISLWAQYVIGIGFAKTANISTAKGVIASFIVWLLFALLTVTTGFGA